MTMTFDEKKVILQTIITVACRNRVSFTSVCIANKLKRMGFWIANRDVASYILDNIRGMPGNVGYDYVFSPISVEHQNTAKLYHHIESDPNLFMARDSKAITPAEFEEINGYSPFDDGEELVAEEVIVPDLPKPAKAKPKFNFLCPN